MRYLPEISCPIRSTLGASVELGIAALMTTGTNSSARRPTRDDCSLVPRSAKESMCGGYGEQTVEVTARRAPRPPEWRDQGRDRHGGTDGNRHYRAAHIHGCISALAVLAAHGCRHARARDRAPDVWPRSS